MGNVGNPALRSLSMGEFVAWETRQSWKHEYLDGDIVAMTGGTRAHDKVRNNIVIALGPTLSGTGCDVYGPEYALRVHADRARFYPDLFVTCRADRIEDQEASSAKWILEVLSPSTQGRDRVEKWTQYRELDELLEYVLIDPTFRRIEIHRRTAGGEWSGPIVCKPDQRVRFESINFEIEFDLIFAGLPPPVIDEYASR